LSISNDAISAIVYLGTKSPDPAVRGSAWLASRRIAIDNPSLVQALMQSLAGDPDDSVRAQAAFALHSHLDEPGVLAALQQAAREDPSREPTVVCCIFTVREAALRASIANRDFRAWTRSMLFDTSLPARSRLLHVLTSTPDERLAMLTDSAADREAARVVFDIGRREQNPKVRQMAWESLRSAAPDDAFLAVLLGDLGGHPDEYVRAAAARVLTDYAGNPDVREALERATDDQSTEVRRVAIDALKRADQH
jgi:HEAT repeat protein